MGALAIAIQALQALIQVASLAPAIKAQYDGIVASLQQMQSENRDPTEAEWQAVHDARAALEAQLNA
jgi:hypothetical protein